MDIVVATLYLWLGVHLHLMLEPSSVLHKNVENMHSPN